MLNEKPLQPLSHGNVLIVGVKASNFGDEIRTNPRVIMWDSQNENWTDKDLPQNVRAVFFTRWVSHSAFNKILTEARLKHLTIFNPEGTGMIAKQVRELLNISRKPTVTEETKPTMATQASAPKSYQMQPGKMKVFIPFIDYNKTNIANAHILMEKAPELGVTSTLLSLANFVGKQRTKTKQPPIRRTKIPTPYIRAKLDVSVEILDNLVKELQDLRDYLVATVDENKTLKMRIERFKKALDND